jgi:hypothetical protein
MEPRNLEEVCAAVRLWQLAMEIVRCTKQDFAAAAVPTLQPKQTVAVQLLILRQRRFLAVAKRPVGDNMTMWTTTTTCRMMMLATVLID